jgi:hypothetical protein
MLRSLALASLGLFLLAGPAAARGDGPAGGQRAGTGAATGGAKVERALLLRRVASYTHAARPAHHTAAACARARGGALRCRSAVQAVSRSWAQGLPPALHVQTQECPAGTMATLAEGHDDIVRCIPI